jgi:hypothetical protein
MTISAVCKLETESSLAEARYAIVIQGAIKEAFVLFDDAQWAYGRWLEQFQPEARDNVLLVRISPMLPAGAEPDFW